MIGSAVVIWVVLVSSSVPLVHGFYFEQFFPLKRTLESAFITEETLHSMKEIFFPAVYAHGQEVDVVRIDVCVQVTIDTNSTSSDSCIATSNLKLVISDETASSNNVSSLCWKLLWTDSALLSMITIDHLTVFDQVFVVKILKMAIGIHGAARKFKSTMSINCPIMPKTSDIETSLRLLLSWSKSYARHRGIPPQWEEVDKGYIQTHYEHYLDENPGRKVHSIRVMLIINFILLNVLVLIGMLYYGEQCYTKLCHIASSSTRLAAVTWASMITALVASSLYLLATIWSFASFEHSRPRILLCLITDEKDWCTSIKSTQLYSDEFASLLIKLTVVPIAVVVELAIAVKLTNHTLLPFPCTVAARLQCRSSRVGKRVIQTILIWSVMVLIQIVCGVILLPVGVVMVIAPGATLLGFSTVLLTLIELIGCLVFFILRWCNPVSFKRCCCIHFCAHMFTAAVIVSLTVSVMVFYYSVTLELGLKPWSVKGLIVSLLPSFLGTPLLWLAKKYIFKKDMTTEGANQNYNEVHNVPVVNVVRV